VDETPVVDNDRMELGGVHVVRILEADGTLSLEVNTEGDIAPWEVIGMLRVALGWEIDAYPLPDDDDI